MKKLKLDLDGVRVETFDTTASACGGEGTVLGHATQQITCALQYCQTLAESCNCQTLAATCRCDDSGGIWTDCGPSCDPAYSTCAQTCRTVICACY